MLKALALLTLTFLASCGDPTQLQADSVREEVSSEFQNSGDGRVFLVNPIVATGKDYLSFVDYNDKLYRMSVTTNPYLQQKLFFTQSYSTSASVDVSSQQNLVEVRNDKDSALIQSDLGGWYFNQDSDEFYQVSTFFHVKDMMNSVFDSLRFAHTYTHLEQNIQTPPAIIYNYANTKSLWITEEGIPQTIQVYSKCKLDEMNSYFSPSDAEICYGYTADNEKFLMSQDPSVVYHELGHAFVKAMMNQRNTKYDLANGMRYTLFHSDLGELFYDEAGSINEGLCDYFSYYMNGRSHIGEWAMGRFFKASRPMTEEDELHEAKVSKEPGKRLSYPNYVNYDPNDKTKDYEDIHYAGQIISHYLVSLTESLKTKCDYTDLDLGEASLDAIKDQITRFDQRWKHIYDSEDSEYDTNLKKHVFASSLVVMLINETLAEIGDLYARGSDLLDPDATGNIGLSSVYFTNFNSDNAYLWAQQVNPPNFRRFFQIFAKNIKAHITAGACPAFSLDESEQLLDEYGLLLFKSYSDNKLSGDGFYNLNDFNASSLSVFSGQTLSAPSSNTLINELNRRNTVLVSKDFIELPTEGTTAYVFDRPSTMKALLANLSFEGASVATTEEVAGVEYNNSNAKISPGEVVGISLNLKNTSNTTIAGLQILANDWDHMKLVDNDNTYVNRTINNTNRSGNLASFSPCIFDNWPLETEGGVPSENDSTTPGNCDYVTRTNQIIDDTDSDANGVYSQYVLDSPQPICMVQYADEEETKWVDQNYFRKMDLELSDSECLNYPQMSGSDFNPNECLVRMLPGATQATFSRVDSQKTWGETMSSEDSSPVFNSSAVILMEVNKWIEPGTTFNCRFRVRFTNCQDCFSDGPAAQDYADYEYAGERPYKVINFKFTVID